MKKRIFSIIALMLVMIMALTSCSYVNKALDFIKENFWILFVIAALVCVLSYVATLQVAKRKKQKPFRNVPPA